MQWYPAPCPSVILLVAQTSSMDKLTDSANDLLAQADNNIHILLYPLRCQPIHRQFRFFGKATQKSMEI